MPILKFSTPWNKRKGRTGCKLDLQCFSSIRLKQAKYKVGEKFEIEMNGFSYGIAQIVDVREFKLAQMSEGMARLDTGYGKEECIGIIKKMYPSVDYETQPFVFITLNYLDGV
jgi:hypothetical protein